MADPTNKLDIKTLGHSGVIIDPNTLEPTVPNDALRVAQNATHDPTQGYGGALRKRPGLRRFNIVSAGAAILGGCPMAVAGTGGAPTGGGSFGSTGSSAGAGDGTGAPGATSDGGAVISSPGAGSDAFTDGVDISTLGSGRLVVIGRADNTGSDQYGQGWFIDTSAVDVTALSLTAPGPPAMSNYLVGWGNCGVVRNGVLYCAKGHPGNVDPTANPANATEIHAIAGTLDQVLFRTPRADTTQYPANKDYQELQAITIGTVGVGPAAVTVLYWAIVDLLASGSSSVQNETTDDSVSRIFLSPLDGSITFVAQSGGLEETATITPGQVGWLSVKNGPFLLGYVVTALAVAQGPAGPILFFGASYVATTYGTGHDVSFRTALIGAIYALGDATRSSLFVSLADVLTTPRPAYQTTALCVYNNRLYAGFAMKSADDGAGTTIAVGFATILSHAIDLTLTDPTDWTTEMTTSGGSAVDGNVISSMVVFKNKLYAAWYNPTQASKIYVFDGTTWSLAISGGVGTVQVGLMEDSGRLYAIASDGTNRKVMWTDDGATWTDVSSNLPSGSNANATIPIVFGMDQAA